LFFDPTSLTYNTSKLLEALQQTSGQKSFADRALETVKIRRLAQRQLVIVVGLDLAQFVFDARVICRDSS
jgi:hypothetical protein